MCRWIFLIAFDCDLSDQPTHYLTLRPKSFICECVILGYYIHQIYTSHIYICYIQYIHIIHVCMYTAYI